MDGSIWWQLFAVLLLLVLVSSTSAARAALMRLNKGRLRHLASEGVPRASYLMQMSENASALELTLVSVNVTGLVLLSAIGTLLIVESQANNSTLEYLLFVVGLGVLVLAQTTSRLAGARRPEGTICLLRWPLLILHTLLRPATKLLSWTIRAILPGEVTPPAPTPAEEELRMIVDAVEEEGALEEEEREMIHGIFEMGERTVHEIMIPRVDVVAVEASEPLRTILHRIKSYGHSRIPIFEESIDNIIGIVYAKDLLMHMEAGSLDAASRTLKRDAHYVPESKKVDELLREMQRDKVHIAVVVDEYGGTAGLITIEDLLEEIVGEIQDEYDLEEKGIEQVGEGEVVLDARVSIHDLSDALGVSIADSEYDTVGGLVYDKLGKIPKVGDELETDGIALKVLSTKGTRISKVRVTTLNPGSDEVDTAEQE